ncbi:hypothetical protein PPSIR1_25019 [Plesiocystis pacifica SIR-1]|uniref:Outer membrane protein beta-barrel domain-containing protein n=1 Tax=Plesiocystis pacifica SIR-1 TaxID=391625 RepID=A6G9J8_9BACT|nr:hypothetical protein [Plesiocystis pacifica]EDM77506.1 hypothetical protein PPSIR1_25019 [Plesiocystis pacifica SIR-1]
MRHDRPIRRELAALGLSGALPPCLALACWGWSPTVRAEAPASAEAPALEAGEEPEPEPEPAEAPPRISGTYFGMGIWPALSWVYSPNLELPHSSALGGGGGALRLGQAVYPWLTLGVDTGGGFYFGPNNVFMVGGLMIDAGVYPNPRHPLSIHVGFGFGAGLLLDDRTETRGGVGGPKFSGSLRYEFFPGAGRKRPKEPGGWAVGPELSWRGFTPAAKGRPMSNTVLLGVWFGYYWGR